MPIYILLAGWDATALSLLLLILFDFSRLDERSEIGSLSTEEMKAPFVDFILLFSSVATIGAVGWLLLHSKDSTIALVVGVGSIIVSWLTVHTVYTLRYAQVYTEEGADSIDFNGTDDPTFWDFAYVAFTVGMTYQISDTNLRTSRMRKLALQHALLSFIFGTAIIATTINLVAGLAR